MAVQMTDSELRALTVQLQQYLDKRLISVQTQFELQTLKCRDYWIDMPEPVPETTYALSDDSVVIGQDGLARETGVHDFAAPAVARRPSFTPVRREDGKELVPGVLEIETQWEFILMDTYVSRLDNEGGENRMSGINQFQNAMCFAPNLFLMLPSLAASFRGFINHPGRYVVPDYRPADSGVDVFGQQWSYEQNVMVLKVLNYAH
jgi:hypothetical protein